MIVELDVLGPVMSHHIISDIFIHSRLQETDTKIVKEPSDAWKTQWKAEEAPLPTPEQSLEDQEVVIYLLIYILSMRKSTYILNYYYILIRNILERLY